ncbi:multidrug and toxin extrusion protein 1-like isoform X2 [Mytilus edulis]|uniref:multidrug and toxin extrusion protein 1-like isoform X2 n=1 Tax=Mytilus edulis TaxID=6550 RepID=UPI0039EE0C24
MGCINKSTLVDLFAGVKMKIFPNGYRIELKELLQLAWPITIETLLQYLILSVSLLFCGHLGKEALDGVQLAITTINVVGSSVIIGLCTAFDTLFSQTFGSNNKNNIGLILQRGILIMLLACIPIFAVFVNTEYLLILVGQNSEVARLSGQYVIIVIAGFPNIVIPGVILQLIANVFNIVYHLILVTGLDLGLRGAAVAVVCTYWTEVLLYLMFIRFSKIYENSWTGFSKEAFLDWNTFLKLAIPGIFMISVDWWSFEISTLVVGILGNVQLAAHSIVFQINGLIFMIPLGLSSAVCIKIGQHVGAGDPIKAQTTSRVGILVGWIAALFTSTFYISMKDIVPKAYTSNREILQLTSKVMPQIATYNFINITMLVLNGILRGTGHQKYGGIVTVIAHYVIGVPLMVVLVLYTSLEIAGVWWAFCTAIVFMFGLYAAKILSISWENECKKAQERTAVNVIYKDPPVFEGGPQLSSECSYSDTKPSNEDYRQLFEQIVEESPPSLFKVVICQRCFIFVVLLLVLVFSIVLNLFFHSKLKSDAECFVNDTMYNVTEHLNITTVIPC